MTVRRFPPPWSVDEAERRCFIIRDPNGQPLAYVYFEEEPGRRAAAKPADPRRGAAHRRQHRQAAGVAGALIRLWLAPHYARQSV